MEKYQISLAPEHQCEVFVLEGEKMLNEYKQVREELVRVIDLMSNRAVAKEEQKIEENLRHLKKKVEENAFYLVVLGQFKRGKSTFINSLLGEKLLPTSVVPLTSIITLLKYGTKEKISVVFTDGTMKEISRDELVDYVTEKGNPRNEKNVSQVIVEYPSDYLKEGVHIIDTPGVGSIFENNTEMTYSFLPKVDAALFLLAVDPPISQSELDFLKDVKQYVHKIFFIQNKIDYMDEDERIESMNFSKKVLEETLGSDEIKIFPLSAKWALEGKLSGDRAKIEKSCLPEFDKTLSDFLMKEKAQVFLNSVIQSTKKLLNDEEFAIRLKLKAIATPLKDLEEKIKLFEEQLENIKQEKHDNSYLFEAEIKRLMDKVDREIQKMQQTQLPRLLEELKRAGEENKHLATSEYVRVMEEKLQKGIVETFDRWVSEQEERLNEEYARISKRFSDRTNKIIESLMDASARLFDIKLERIETDEAISEERRFYYLLGDPPKFFDLEGALDFFSRAVLPKGYSQTKMLKKIIKKLPERIDANCGRVRADFMRRIKESFLDFRWNLNMKIDATANSIKEALEKAVEMKKASSEEVRTLEKELLRELNTIEELKARLDKIQVSLAGKS